MPPRSREDEAPHLRVPAARLVAEMDSGLQQLSHGDDGHGQSSLRFGLSMQPAGVRVHRPAAGTATRPFRRDEGTETPRIRSRAPASTLTGVIRPIARGDQAQSARRASRARLSAIRRRLGAAARGRRRGDARGHRAVARAHRRARAARRHPRVHRRAGSASRRSRAGADPARRPLARARARPRARPRGARLRAA